MEYEIGIDEEWDEDDWENLVKSIRREKKRTVMRVSGMSIKDTERIVGERARGER